MSDTTELYYAEMEAARIKAEDEYFTARPQLLGSITERALFRAGFERAFRKLWQGEIKCRHCGQMTEVWVR